MPIYEYYCPDNQQTIEVIHKVEVTLKSWAELCELARTPIGLTPPNTPIERTINGRYFVNGKIEDLSKGKQNTKDIIRTPIRNSCCGGSCGGH
jgi:hypothetical protein